VHLGGGDPLSTLELLAELLLDAIEEIERGS